jgi:hypothetical protein
LIHAAILAVAPFFSHAAIDDVARFVRHGVARRKAAVSVVRSIHPFTNCHIVGKAKKFQIRRQQESAI